MKITEGNQENNYIEYKGYSIRKSEIPSERRISTIGPGSVPKFLRGLYNCDHLAKRQIDIYLLSGGRKDASTN